MSRLFFSLIILFYNGAGFSQNGVAYDNLLRLGERQVSAYNDIFEELHLSLYTEPEEKIFAFYSNRDTTCLFIMTERVSSYDPTNNIDSDEHNKVNFITFGEFDGKPSPKHSYRTLSAIYYPLEGKVRRWYSHASDDFISYPIQLKEGRLSYLSREIPLVLIHEKEGGLNEEFWKSGLFAPVRDLRLDPNWDSYGKNVWKKKEQALRPFIGIPELVRQSMLKSQKD